MLELTSDGRPVRLSPGTSVQLEVNSPLFDEDTILGAFTYSVAVPAPPNGPLYGHPERPDAATPAGTRLPAVLSDDGVPVLTGTQRVKTASATKYSVQVAGGLSGAGLSERQLSSFAYGGLRAVPRWVDVDSVNQPGLTMPGLVRHANEVVAKPAAYDYVFAPLRNDSTESTGAVVNPWTVETVPIEGMFAGGCFAYHIRIPILVGSNARFGRLPSYCPFPKLRYVLRAICEEAGLAVDLPNLLPGELGELVVTSTAQLVDRGDGITLRFSLADVLPALTVAELLAALRQDLGVAVYVDPATGRVRSAYLGECVAVDAAYVDLTDLRAGEPESTIDDEEGVTLTYQVDADDELTREYLDRQPDPSQLLPPVATAADLPTSLLFLLDNPQAGRLSLVQDEDAYYHCTIKTVLATVSLEWTLFAPRLPSIAVNGGGEPTAQRLCYLPELPVSVSFFNPALTFPVPAISQPPFIGGEVARSSALRLVFYRGLRPASDGVSMVPSLSHRSPSGRLSVRLSGPEGTYAQLLAGWLPVKLSGTSYQQPLRLSALDLARLDLSRPVRLDGVPYLVRGVKAAVPLRKPVAAELVRLF